MHRFLRLIPLGALALACLLAAAQDASVFPEIRTTSRPYLPHVRQFSATSNLVEARVVVRDSHGNPVADLPQSAFQILVDGKPAALDGFSVETAPAVGAAPAPSSASAAPAPATTTAPRPRYVAIFLDDLSLDHIAVVQARNAARRLRASDLAGNIQLGIFTSSGTVALSFTSDSSAWDAALARVQFHALMPRQGIVSGVNFSPEMAYWVQQSPSPKSPFTALAQRRMMRAGLCFTPDSCNTVVRADADATVHAAEDASSAILDALQHALAALASQPGDRVLLLTSTGFFTDTMMPRLQDVAQQALHDNIVIDSLDAKLLETVPPRASALEQSIDFQDRTALNTPLETLAAATGGAMFENNNDLFGALRRDASQPEVAYALSFTPIALPYDGKFHSIKVEVTGVQHAAVQARKGYYDPAPDDDLYRAASPQAVDDAVLGPARPGDLPVHVETAWQQDRLRVQVRIDADKLHLGWCRENRHCDDLIFTSAIFDQQGQFVTGKTGAMSLALTSHGFDQLRKTGLGANLSLHLPPGAYRLREVIQEGNRSQLIAFDQEIHAQN